jgi:hypothetical protein
VRHDLFDQRALAAGGHHATRRSSAGNGRAPVRAGAGRRDAGAAVRSSSSVSLR